MNRRFATFNLLAALLLACTVSAAFAQDDSQAVGPKPMFKAYLRSTLPAEVPGKQLVQWNGSFTDLTHVKRSFTMVGTNPASTNVTTTTTIWVIPIKFVYDASHGNKTFDPNHKLSNGRSVVQNILKSPLFNARHRL